MSAVENEVVAATYFRNSVDGEANALVHKQEEIEQAERDDTRVNDRRRQHHEEARVHDVRRQPCLQLALLGNDAFFEGGFPAFPVIAKGPLLFLQSSPELFLQRLNADG